MTPDPTREQHPGEYADDEFEDGDDDFACTHCGGEGDCMDGADPLDTCPDEPHRCHACGGSGKRRDQRIF